VIVVAGEALIDLVPETAPAGPGGGSGPAVPAARPLRPRRGGGPYNTAVALARLGTPTAFCSRLSTDAFGDWLLAGLHADGADTSLVRRGEEPTTLVVAVPGPDGSAAYRFYVEGTADRLFDRPVDASELPDGTRAVCFGTCSLALEPGASAYERLLRSASAAGLLTVLDPNVRPAVIPDADAYRARFRGWLPEVGLLKLSAEDAEWLGGGPEDWLAAGAGAVVLTRGGEGAEAWTRGGGRIPVPAERVAVADTIGAGDTLTAALLHRLRERGALDRAALAGLGAEDWREALAFAARAAAVTCSRPGADPPYARELAALPGSLAQ